MILARGSALFLLSSHSMEQRHAEQYPDHYTDEDKGTSS